MAQRLMWSFFVVLLHPLFGLLSDFAQLLKHKHVEHRFAVAAIEPLDETILHRLAWFEELEQHAMCHSKYDDKLIPQSEILGIKNRLIQNIRRGLQLDRMFSRRAVYRLPKPN